MASELPLKIRVDIRDQWDSPKSVLQNSVTTLTATLGHKIAPSAQWPLLWGSLKESFPDVADFVPAILTYTSAWYEQLNGMLENDAYAEWTEQLLSVLSNSSGPEFTLNVEVQGSTGPHARRLRTYWDETLKSFYLCIPRGPLNRSLVATSINKELTNLFDSRTSRAQQSEIDEEGWADVEESDVQSTTAAKTVLPGPVIVGGQTQPIGINKPRALPTIASLGRPSDLLRTSTPHLLIIEAGNPMMVQCSHQPSLELLAQYLNKWAKTNRNDSQKRSILAVDLIESDFSVGVIDAIRIEPNIAYGRSGPINPTIVMAFVEGILGYKSVHSMGNRFVYRSEDALN